jgi:urease accessory protein
MKTIGCRFVLLALALLTWGGNAEAHIVAGEATGFFSGVLHPVSGLDHILAMVSVGVWGAQLGEPAIWILPLTFPVMMAFGGLLGFLGMTLPATEIGIALSMVVLGAAVMLEARPPLPVVMAIVAFFAIFHGYAHGTELPRGDNALLYSLGFIVATGLLHLVGITVGLIHRWRASPDRESASPAHSFSGAQRELAARHSAPSGARRRARRFAR